MMRGQTFPLWLGNILLTLVFSAFIVSYGYLVSFQMRAQATADSVAAGMVAIQAQQFNQMTAGLYASAVEEYRLRHLLESYRLASMGAGGCQGQSPDCDATWQSLKRAYAQATARYDQDVRYVNSVTYSMNFTNVRADAVKLAGLVDAACTGNATAPLAGKFACGDKRSPMRVSFVDMQVRRGVKSGRADATNMVLPSYYGGMTQNANQNVFYPVKAEVVACASVPLFFSWIPGLQHFRQNVWARGAAANALVEQDWFQPGYIESPLTGKRYQPAEVYGAANDTGLASSYGPPLNWYSVNFGGSPANTSYQNAQTSQIKAAVRDEAFIVKTGWWGPVPIFPFVGGDLPPGACPGGSNG